MALTAKKVYAILKRQISDMEAKLNSPIRYRGTVATADLLPLNPDIGDMYNIESKSVYGEAGMNVAWNGVAWDTMGAPIDMSLYIKSSELADWVKQQNKPTYTAEEVGALPADTKIPSKTSDLHNDSGFLTKIPDNYLSGTDKTLSVSEKAADAKATGDKITELSDDISNKLNKNQGSENSGKIAGINESGDIVPMFPIGVEYNSETNCLEFGSDQKMELNQGIGIDSTLTKSGSAADAGATGKEINSLKSDLNDIEGRIVQYSNLFNKDDVELGYIWSATNQGVSKKSYNNWGVLKNPVKLKANTTYFIKGFWLDKSWTPFYKSDGTYDTSQSLVTIESLAGQWHGKWTVGNEDCLINVSVDSAYLDKAYISEVYDEYKPYMEIDYSPLAKELSDKVDTIFDILPDISNLLNKNDVEEGKRWYATTSSVQKTNDSSNTYSVLNNNIRLKANTTYYAYGMWSGFDFTPFYDVDGNYDKTQSLVTIENIGTYHYRYIVGNNDCYINVTLINSEKNKAYISEYADFYVDYGNIDFSFKSPYNTERIQNIESDISNKLTMYDKKVLIIGDSISSDDYYHTKGSKMWVDVLREEGFLNNDTLNNNSVHATGFMSTLGDNPESTFINRLKKVENPLDYDVVITIGGVNDGAYSKFNINDIKSAINEYFSYLTSTFLNARLLVVSPTYGFANYDTDTVEIQAFDALKEISKNYHLPVLNATDESGWNPKIDAQMEMYSLRVTSGETSFADRLHPNEDFHRRFYAPFIKGFLKRFI